MNQHNLLSARLQYLIDNNLQHLLSLGLKGLEKESLRISKNGVIAQTPHPVGLGSALTHPNITTDYSEALLEFITPPFADIRDTLAFMRSIHQFVYMQMPDELLLAASMPCGIDGDESVPIADYGKSNIGKMKHIYRKGLWYRYGRTMQAIAGIHFNYSIPDALWPVLHQYQGGQGELADFIAEGYFGLIRNFQRMGWLILYLFGASPAICKSFFNSRPHLRSEFDEFDEHTLYLPYATSLRMSDIGYKSKNQAGLAIDYNSLAGYVSSLSAAINTPFADYEAIGVKDGEDYKQLNANLLQIENEFYSTMRPKQIAKSGEKPTLALQRRGVLYVEMRSLDLNLFEPLGISETTARFIEAFLLSCLLQDSPKQTAADFQINNQNQLTVANQGRKPGVLLNRQGESVSLQHWAQDILQAMQPVCALLDENLPEPVYSQALELQMALVNNPDLTPSAQILAGMRNNSEEFGCFAMHMSAAHERQFRAERPSDDCLAYFQQQATQSIEKQQAIEAADSVSFDAFLADYFAQTL